MLSKGDPYDRARKTSHCKVYTVPLVAGKTYQIDMVSKQIDSYLRLETATGTQLAEDDDSGGFPNARIVFHCRQAGSYRIICTTFQGQAMGGFTMTVRERP